MDGGDIMNNDITKTIKISWSIEDIQSQGDNLTDTQAGEVLNMLKANHDASIGINWDIINDTITAYQVKQGLI